MGKGRPTTRERRKAPAKRPPRKPFNMDLARAATSAGGMVGAPLLKWRAFLGRFTGKTPTVMGEVTVSCRLQFLSDGSVFPGSLSFSKFVAPKPRKAGKR